MARFCTECGKEIAPDVVFCTECGTKFEQAEPKPTPSVPPVTQTPPTEPVNKPYVAPTPDDTNKVVSTGAYFGLMILFAIPIVGLIACIIMAFVPKNKNLKNYARAMLIWSIITLIIAGLLIALIFLLTNSLVQYINQISDGQFGDFGDFFGQFSEFGDTMNEFGNMTQQFENGGLNSLPLE